MSIQQFPETNFNSRGGMAIYGPGTDGNVIITGTVVLNRDMYYNNLTVLGSAQLDTNGYRVFVKDTLNMADASAVIGRLSDTTSIGTLLGGATSGVKASDTLGGNGGLNPGENFFGEAEFYNFSQAIAGYKFDAVENTLRFLMGGSGGAIGESGSAGQSGSFTSGQPGQSGSAGQLGTRPGFENVVGASGGMGYPGSPGSPGNPGIGGTGGAGGDGGLGGAGGGVVIISARNVVGSGVIRADGKSGSPGNPGYPGLEGSEGSPGSPGAPGAPAPDFFSASYVYTSQPAYNYAVEYSFTNPATGGNARTTYNTPTEGSSYYTFGPTILFLNAYNSPTLAYNTSNAYTVPGNAFTVPGNARTSPGNARTTYNARTLGPASVRYRSPNASTTYNRPSTTYNIPSTAYNRPSTAFNAPNAFFNPGNIYQYATYYYSRLQYYFYNTGTARTTYNAIVPGNISYGYNTVLEPAQFAIEPAQYFVGGEGGRGGAGGEGGIGSSGLPGSPGLNGYSGGGGVVLLITEYDIPDNIEVRAASGTGDGGSPTSGTVIIIKNEVVQGAY